MFQTERSRRWCRARKPGNWGARVTERGIYGDNYFADKFRRQREVAYGAAVARRLIPELAAFAGLREPAARRRLLEIGALALRDAGYSPRRRSPIRLDGKVSKNAAKQVRYLMGMPRVQTSIADELEVAGCGPKEAAKQIASIALGKVEATAVEQAVRLRALDMIVRLTVGYVPTKSIGAHANIPADQFFNDDEFQTAPPIAAANQEPKNVTPGQRGGRHRRR